MPIEPSKIPLSLYVHIPWCVQKCPYCDFNSHALNSPLQEDIYIAALLDNIDHYKDQLNGREIHSIFIGGGTPSLFSGKAIDKLLNSADHALSFSNDIEITLEANPGTVDQKHFADYRAAGVNRLSIGVQSMDDDKLAILGRIHQHEHAINAVRIAKDAGFDNFNLDIMFGLPKQSEHDALADLEKALDLGPTHFSWYQLTIEPNTVFYKTPPPLPPDDHIWQMQQAGIEKLHTHGFTQYEVSAYATAHRQCRHNLNYWQFGDYLGIGAGAHSKLTTTDGIIRFAQVRQPNSFLDKTKRRNIKLSKPGPNDLPFEFMLNALRLTDGFYLNLFEERTGMPLSAIMPTLTLAEEKKLIGITQTKKGEYIRPLPLGKQFLNDLVSLFL